MKLLKISSKKKSTKSVTNEKDGTMVTDDAVVAPQDTPKKESSSATVKRKKFGLFSKSKSKEQKGTTVSTPPRTANNEENATTPDTVPENDAYDLSTYNVLSVVPFGNGVDQRPKGSTRTEDILQKNRSLLAQLNTVDTHDGPDGAGEEGTELILPMPSYEIDEDVSEEKIDDEAKEIDANQGNETFDNNRITVVDQSNEENVEEDVIDIQKPTETNDTVDLNNGEESAKENIESESKKEGEGDVKSDVEDNDNVQSDVQGEDVAEYPQEAEGFQQGFVASSAVRIWTTTFGCGDLEAADSCSALPVILQKDLYKSGITRAPPVDLNKMFDERTGSDFLHHMVNVGYTLIYHIAVEEDSWVGRTVSLAFHPGTCSAERIVQPAIEWNTMAGGKSSFAESKSIGLLNIDAIAASNLREEGGDGNELPSPTERSSLPIPAKPPTNPKNDASVGLCSSRRFEGLNLVGDEFDCFFTITTQDGEIHLFEALDAEDCRRIVAGIRFNARRLSRILIEGDSEALMSDYYDNSKEPEDSVLSNEMVLTRLSNAYFDE